MKYAIVFLFHLLIGVCCVAQKVGIGTLSPDLKLTIDDDGGLVAKGIYGAGAVLTTSGNGSRFVWYPRKGAMRAGVIDGASDGTNWDEGSIGSYSLATGRNTRASNTGDVALGWFSNASGGSSVAMGNFSTASGYISTAIGYAAQATGQASFAANAENAATGYGSAAFGTGNFARGYATFSIGQYNDPVLAADQPFSDDGTANTPMFIIGNGAAPDNRSNAMVTIRSGETGFGKNPSTGNYSDARLQVKGKGSNDILKIENSVGDKYWSFFVNSVADAALQFFYQGNYKGSFSISSGNYVPVSDRRVKKDIAPVNSTLANLLQIQPYSYHYLSNEAGSPLTYGFMAQDIRRFYPDMVHEIPQRDGSNLLTLDYTGLHAVEFKAIQEQNEIIKSQQEKIDLLEKKLEAIEKMLLRKE